MLEAETGRARIAKRLEAEGWILARHGAEHDVYRYAVRGVVSVPRHRILSPGVARQIAKVAGWICRVDLIVRKTACAIRS